MLKKVSESQLKCVCIINLLEYYRVLRRLIILRLREESLKQSALFEEIERVKQLALHDVVSKPHADAISKKKKETKIIKRVPISKNTYSSKVQKYYVKYLYYVYIYYGNNKILY